MKRSNIEKRPWGGFRVLEDTPAFKAKRIWVLPGHRLSYQKHFHRSENWVVVEGNGTVTLDGKERKLSKGETVHIPVETAHRLTNTGTKPLTIIEVQLGDYFGEDDILRLEDDYGRTPTDGEGG